MKLKTIRVHATLQTDLYQDINVPESATREEIWKKIKEEGIVEEGDMVEVDCGGSWTWDRYNDIDFIPDALYYPEDWDEEKLA